MENDGSPWEFEVSKFQINHDTDSKPICFVAFSTYCHTYARCYDFFDSLEGGQNQGSPFAEMTQAVGNPLVFGLKRPRDKRFKNSKWLKNHRAGIQL